MSSINESLNTIKISKAENYEKMMYNSYLTGTALVVSGDPGIGKTEIAKSFFEREGIKCAIVEPQLWGGIAAGLPVLEKYNHEGKPDTEELTLSRVKWLEDAVRDGVEVIIFDDMDKLPPNEVNMLYRLFTDRYLGNNKVDDKLRFMCLGNYNVKSTGVEGVLPSPIVNRTAVVEFTLDSSDWLEWSMAAKNKDGSYKMDQKLWAFLRINQNYINSFEDVPQRVFPTPRSWVNASKWLTMMQTDKRFIEKFGSFEDNKDFVLESIAAFVGPKAAHEFMTVYDRLNMSVDEILKSKPKDVQDEVIYSTILGSSTTPKNADKIINYIYDNIKTPDIVGMYCQRLNETCLEKDGTVNVEVINKALDKLNKKPGVSEYFKRIFVRSKSNELDTLMK